ncbi:MAG: pseudouridine synthase [Candidatus Saccharimonas sp.]
MSSSTDSQRLNKYLALTLGISRREADNLIEKGNVTLNDKRAILGAQYEAGDHIQVDGKPLSDTPTQLVYLALNKPVGYVCSRRAQGDSPTIYELLPTNYHHLKPVGRLDRNSSGLILLTNDGDFAYQMTHPKFYKTKIYYVKLDHDLAPLHQQMISDFGIQLEDGPSKLSLMKLGEDDASQWQVTMSEGRNRQIRRTFSSLGYTVIRLHRIQFGSYSLGDIPRGKFIEVSIS